jgi:hypothetical protein
MTIQSTTVPASETSGANALPESAPVSRPLGWLAAGVLIVLWSYAVYRLGTLWYSSTDYAYGWFVPLLCLGLFWERWKHRPAPEPPEASTGPLIVWGILALAIAPAALLVVAQRLTPILFSARGYGAIPSAFLSAFRLPGFGV